MPLRAPFGLAVLGGIQNAGHGVAVHFAGEGELQVVAGAVLENVAVDADGIAIDCSTQVAPYEIA